MEVKDIIMYHYQNTDNFNNIWQVGNIITIKDTFESNFCKNIYNYSSGVDIYNTNNEFVRRTTFGKYLDELRDRNAKLDSEEYKGLLDAVIGNFYQCAISNREEQMENYRKEHYPNLPSRLHSIWLTEEKSLEFWKSKLGKTDYLNLFKVQVTGELFKSSDCFVPDDILTNEEMYEFVDKYWNPNFTNKVEEERAEYLFQGKVKVLEKQIIK